MNTTIAAVIRTFNRREFLLEALASVYAQTRPPDEVIVSVDGSTDGSADAVRAAFPEATVLEQPNRGRSIAANRAVAHATSQYLAFLDDDDLWHPSKLELTDDYLKSHPDCLALNTWFYVFAMSEHLDGDYSVVDFVATTLGECVAESSSITQPRSEQGYLDIVGRSYEALLGQNAGALSTSVIDRDVFITAGGFGPPHAYGDDWSLFTNVARLTEWNTLRDRLTFVRVHDRPPPGDAVAILATHVNMWLSGRPLPSQSSFSETASLLASFGPSYRHRVQELMWSEIRRGELRRALTCLRIGRSLLPRVRDRAYVLIPPPITWRVGRRGRSSHAD